MTQRSLIEHYNNQNQPCDKPSFKCPLKIEGTDREKSKLARAVKLVMKSKPYGQHAIAMLKKHDYTLVLTSAEKLQGLCDHDKKTVYLGANFDDERLAFTLVHEAAHAEQYSKYTPNAFGHNNLKSEIMVTRILEADADAKAMMYAYDMKERGDNSIYEKMAKDSPEIAYAFEESISNKPENLHNGKALEAAFDAWFDNDAYKFSYEKSYYVKELTNITENEQEDCHDFDNNINPAEIVSKICTSHDGKMYFSKNPSALNNDKYVDVAAETKAFFNAWFSGRKSLYGLEEDFSLKDIPVRNKDTREYPASRAIVAPSARDNINNHNFNKSFASKNNKSGIISMRNYFSR